MPLLRNYEPDASDPRWTDALTHLRAAPPTIAHIDSGLYPHPGIGLAPEGGSPTILMELGRNFVDPKPGQTEPWTDLSRWPAALDERTQIPDHGVATLGILVGNDAHFTGVCPGIRILPYRAANGPVFLKRTSRNPMLALVDAIDHAVKSAQTVEDMIAISISMGNPAHLGIWETLLAFFGRVQTPKGPLRDVLRKAYQQGIPIFCAAGQIIDSVVYPARFKTRIAISGFLHNQAGMEHYPVGGYRDGAHLIDGWALAGGMNVPRGRLDADGNISAQWAENTPGAGNPSGTSYAAPYAAGAYALWFAKYRDELTGPDFSGTTAWHRVEAFRLLLRDMPPVEVDSGLPQQPGKIRIRPVNIPYLLDRPPSSVSGMINRAP